MADLIDVINESAQGPQEAEADGTRVKQHPLKDVIEADKYQKASDGASAPHRGLRFTKLIPPGAD